MWQITFSCCYTNSSYSQNKIYKYWTTHNLNKKIHPPHISLCHIYCLMVGFSSKYLIIISRLSLKTKLDRTSYDLLSLAEPSVRYCEFRLQHRGSGVIMDCCLFIKHHRPVIYGRPLHYLPEGLNFHSWKATVVVFFYIWENCHVIFTFCILTWAPIFIPVQISWDLIETWRALPIWHCYCSVLVSIAIYMHLFIFFPLSLLFMKSGVTKCKFINEKIYKKTCIEDYNPKC